MDAWIEGELVEENEKVEIEKEYRLLWFLWSVCQISLVVLLFMCVGFGEMLQKNIKPNQDIPLGLLRIVFFCLSIASLGIAIFLRKMILAGKLNSFVKQTAKSSDASNKPFYLIKYRIGAFLPMAVSSTPGYLGFFLFMLGGDALTLYLLLIIATLGMIYHRPKKMEMLELLRIEKAEQ